VGAGAGGALAEYVGMHGEISAGVGIGVARGAGAGWVLVENVGITY
jgi:hypothetical protein